MSESGMRVACIKLREPTQLTAIAEACLRFTPQISLREDGILFLEIGKSRKLYSEASFRARTQAILRRFGVQATIGIAANIPAALSQSWLGTSEIQELGIHFLPEFIDPFLKSTLSREATQKMLEVFTRLGVKTVGEFLRIPAAQLPSRFGSMGLLLRQRVENPEAIVWIPWTPEEKIVVMRDLRCEEQCRTLEPLLFEFKSLLEPVFARLRGRSRRLSRLRIELELDRRVDRVRVKRDWTLEFLLPQGSSLGALPVLRERLGRDFERAPLGAPVIGVRLEVLEHVPGFEGQRAFFKDAESAHEDQSAVLSYIAESIGREYVFRAELTEDRLPELSWKRSISVNKSTVDLSRLPSRPSRLIGKPVRVEIRDERISFAGRDFPVVEWSEVERISAHWLDGIQVRDYFKVEIENGCPLWIFQNAGEYYLHGYFV